MLSGRAPQREHGDFFIKNHYSTVVVCLSGSVVLCECGHLAYSQARQHSCTLLPDPSARGRHTPSSCAETSSKRGMGVKKAGLRPQSSSSWTWRRAGDGGSQAGSFTWTCIILY